MVTGAASVWLENGQNRGTVTYSSTQEAIRALQTLPGIQAELEGAADPPICICTYKKTPKY